MTFTDLVTEIMSRLNYTSSDATARVGRAINDRYKRVTTSIGLDVTRRVVVGAVTVIGTPLVTVANVEKILNIQFRNKPLELVTIDILRSIQPSSPQSAYAVFRSNANSVQIELSWTPTAVESLVVDGYALAPTLAGSQVPAFPESFHDVLIWGSLAEEYRRLEKGGLVKDAEQQFESRLSDLRMFIAANGYNNIFQGKLANKQDGIVGSALFTGGGGSGGSGGGGAVADLPHNLLDGSVHPDTLAASPVRGDIVVANSTPLWTKLAIGTTGKFLRTNGTDPSWQRINGATDIDGPLKSAVQYNLLGTPGGNQLFPTRANSNILLYDSGSDANMAAIGADTAGALYFVAGNTAAASRMAISPYNGRVAVTESFEVAKGVQFPAAFVDQADANCLDDYEEGSFTPVLGGSTSESGQTYTTQSGNYVKIGCMVHVGIYVQFSNKGTITGNLYVKNLPFAGGGGSATHAASVGYMTNLSNAGTPNPRRCVMGYLLGASTSITMFSVDDFNTVNPVQMTGTDVNNTTQLIISLTYRTNY
jgi:hypothetical protein